jgi:hypothetical protein
MKSPISFQEEISLVRRSCFWLLVVLFLMWSVRVQFFGASIL